MPKKRPKQQGREFVPGVKEFILKADPKTLTPHPENPKKHPHRQRQAFLALHEDVGWAGAVVLNRITNNIVDGHMRREEAIKKGITVPLLIGEWTPEQERKLLLMKDPIGSMAQYQAEAMTALTESVHTQLQTLKDRASQARKEILTRTVSDLDTYASDIAAGDAPSVLLERKRSRKEYDKNRSAKADKKDSHETGIYRQEMAEDPIFSSSNSFGIPDFKTETLGTEAPRSVWTRSKETCRGDALYCYSAGPSTFPAPSERDGGTLGFFTEDFRFERCWNDVPAFCRDLLGWDFRSVLCPDFSTWADWPLAIRLHQLYKSRFVARYWQEAGIPVIPIVQSIGPTEFDDDDTPDEETLSATLCLHTLPQRLPVLATEARNSQGEEGYWAGWSALHRLALQIVKPEVLVIYGGQENAKFFKARLPKTKTEIILLSSFITRRRKGD